MWERAEYPEITTELAHLTTSIWGFADRALVGVMRPKLLGPPILWFVLKESDFAGIRVARRALDFFQKEVIKEPLVLAEVDLSEHPHIRFAEFLGFHYLHSLGPRALYERTV